MVKTSLEQIRNDPKVINSFDYSNYIDSNLPIDTEKLKNELNKKFKILMRN